MAIFEDGQVTRLQIGDLVTMSEHASRIYGYDNNPRALYGVVVRAPLADERRGIVFPGMRDTLSPHSRPAMNNIALCIPGVIYNPLPTPPYASDIILRSTQPAHSQYVVWWADNAINTYSLEDLDYHGSVFQSEAISSLEGLAGITSSDVITFIHQLPMDITSSCWQPNVINQFTDAVVGIIEMPRHEDDEDDEYDSDSEDDYDEECDCPDCVRIRSRNRSVESDGNQ